MPTTSKVMSKERIPELLANLARYLPGYNHRPGQLDMAAAVANAIEDRHNLVVEGGTGIGKSMAYLVPGILSVVEEGKRVLVATSHKPLLDQIARKDLPLVARLFRDEGYR